MKMMMLLMGCAKTVTTNCVPGGKVSGVGRVKDRKMRVEGET